MRGSRGRGFFDITRAALVLLAAGCGGPSFGDMPALCVESGVCPDGYDCIHGVCALPGTPVPITVGVVPYLRGSDVRVVPQASGVLVAWETYAYSDEGQRFVGARVTREGAVSTRMDLVRFVAEDDSLEPYFDVLSVGGDRVLVAISAPSLPEDPAVEPRLVTYRVDLPPEGREGDPTTFEPAWAKEYRLDTVGYGAVSSPKLLQRGSRVDLGYVRSRTTVDADGNPATVADLAIFAMQQDGTLFAPEPLYHPARAGLPVAVGVQDAFALDAGAWWILDNERPSAALLPDFGSVAEAKLGRLAIPVAADAASLTYIEPSARLGDKLPTDPVAGPAELRTIGAPVAGDPTPPVEATKGTLPGLRDTPRPAWISRAGAHAILVTPGEAVDAPSILVFLVDPATGAATRVAEVPRFSTRVMGALHAVLASGKLFVGWLETDEASATIRMAILPEPSAAP